MTSFRFIHILIGFSIIGLFEHLIQLIEIVLARQLIDEAEPLVQIERVECLILHDLRVYTPNTLEVEEDLLQKWPLLSL